MGKVVITEHGRVTYRGELPKAFSNSNMNCTGLDKATPEFLLKRGIYPLEVIKPEPLATQKIDGYVDELVKNVNVQTFLVREKTQVDLDAEIASKYRQKIEAEKDRVAIASLIEKKELPTDFKI